MTENGDPLENPIAERINGIIKDEYLKRYHYNTIQELEEKLNEIVPFYNNERPHSSCSMLPPAKVHETNLTIKRRRKAYYRSKGSTAVP
jgi:transposase InsO family protein